MADVTLNNIKIQQLNFTNTQWTTSNPKLDIGQFGYEKDTGKTKIGNGIDNWNTLEYLSAGSSDHSTNSDYATNAGHSITSDTAINANHSTSSDTSTISNSADKLSTPRTIVLSGDVTGSAVFDGSGDIDIVTSGGGSSEAPEWKQTFLEVVNTASGVIDIAFSGNSSIYKCTENVSVPTTVTFGSLSGMNLESNDVFTFEIHMNISSNPLITWPTNVSWLDHEEFPNSTDGYYMFVFRTMNQGTTWVMNLQGWY